MTNFLIPFLEEVPKHCIKKARRVVLNIIKSSETPLATRDIYKLAIKPAHESTPAPDARQPLRSMRYLKTVVLPDLVAQDRVEKVMTRGDGFTAWLWKPRDPQAGPASPRAATLTHYGLTPAAVGVGVDWSHLNARRERARKLKLESDLHRMLHLQKSAAAARNGRTLGTVRGI